MAEKEERVITLEEVKEHSNSKSAWIAIHDKVYDITPFLDEHPGGEEVLMEQAGKDGTEQFEDVAHSMDARELMKEYCVGTLHESDRTTLQPKKSSLGGSSTGGSESSWMNMLVPLGVALIVAAIIKMYWDK